MRLIDVDKITDFDIANYLGGGCCSCIPDVRELLNDQPTAFDLEKVLSEMHESIESCMNGAAVITGAYWNKGIEHCIEIVERGGKVK